MESAQDQSQVADNFTQLMLSSDIPAPSDPRGTHAAGTQSKTRSNLAPPEMRLLEPSRPTNPTLLQKRQTFHSRRAQISQKLDDLVGVTQDQKEFMHLWNSFRWKQRVEAENFHWACKAFLTEHGKELLGTPELAWTWRIFMLQRWEDGLIDGTTFDDCNRILENISKN